MATIIFYEKPGCGGNARQKRALTQAGHDLVVRNILTEPFSASGLRAFFGDLPTAHWFNPSAPAVKSGAIDPASMDEETALAHMLAEPILIRRPLLEKDGKYCAGFDPAHLAARLGLTLDETAPPAPDGCIHPDHSHG